MLGFESRGQAFRFAGMVEHTKPDGSVIPLAAWETACPDCGRPHVVKTKPEPDLDRLRRRCDACKAPGRKVRIGSYPMVTP